MCNQRRSSVYFLDRQKVQNLECTLESRIETYSKWRYSTSGHWSRSHVSSSTVQSMGCTLTIGAKIVPFRSLLVPNTTRAESALVEQRHKCLHNAEFSSALRQFAASGHHSVNTNNACSATLPGAEQTETLGEKRQKGPVGLTSLCSAAPLPFTSTFSPNSKFNN